MKATYSIDSKELTGEIRIGKTLICKVWAGKFKEDDYGEALQKVERNCKIICKGFNTEIEMSNLTKENL
jgi:hypothetical protein